MDITPKRRTKMVILNKHTSMTQKNIAKECGVHLKAVNKNLKKKEKRGSLRLTEKEIM